MIKRICLLPFFLCLTLIGLAQTKAEIRPLAPGQSVEREMAGGETHTYEIKLTAGQFMRVVVEQKGIDVAPALSSPDGKLLVESDLTGIIGAREPLSYGAAAGGAYQLVIRANGTPTQSGAYQVRLELKAAASAQDSKRLTAEQLFRDSRGLYLAQKYTDAQLSEKLEHSLALWRELDDRYWQAFTLNLIGITYYGAGQSEKAIQPYEQALALWREEKMRAGEATVLNNLGNAYRGLSRYDKAVEYYEQVLAIRRELKDRSGEATSLSDLGEAYERLSRYEKALEYLQPALAINRELKNRLGEVSNLNDIGWLNGRLSRYDKAIEYSEQALAIARELKNRNEEGLAINGLATAYQGLKRYDKAPGAAHQSRVQESQPRSGQS